MLGGRCWREHAIMQGAWRRRHIDQRLLTYVRHLCTNVSADAGVCAHARTQPNEIGTDIFYTQAKTNTHEQTHTYTHVQMCASGDEDRQEPPTSTDVQQRSLNFC